MIDNNLVLGFGIVAIALWIPLAFMALKRDLMIFQQNSYRPERYARWAQTNGESTTIARCCYLFAAFLLMVKMVPLMISCVVASVIAAWNLAILLRMKYKKPLVFTPRAKRIMGVACLISIVLVAGGWFIAGIRGATAVAYLQLFASALIMLLANLILKPVEKTITRKYYNEAKNILQSMPGLKIIGVTGSYGKTSTKHYLHRILSEEFETLMTPGSYNTTLGVVRTIREQLKPYDEVFIVEMGAKQPGDIKEICDLVNPEYGVITAVGQQHLETFKTVENVQRTKFELFDALPDNGFAVINNDFEYVANRPTSGKNTVRYAVKNQEGADVTVSDIVYGRDGTSFTMHGPGERLIELKTPLVGECNISNLLAAITIALKLGVSESKIKYAVANMQQVEHRLNMKSTPGGLTIIDDAFNSNPDGSRMALDVLSVMTGGRRIVITPGMIELGEKQYDLNRQFGERIGRSADIAIVVGLYNRDAIVEGIMSVGFPESNLHMAATFAEAQKKMLSLAKPGDTVLYENDLPDTFK